MKFGGRFGRGFGFGSRNTGIGDFERGEWLAMFVGREAKGGKGKGLY
jgi:hypothetical protein